MNKISGILLAGGKSKRFGSDKRLADLNGKKLLDIALGLLSKISDDIVVVVSKTNNIELSNCKVIQDTIEGKGPLVGIYTGLNNIKYEKAVLIPVDTPFVTVKLLELLISQSSGYDVVIPKWNDYIEPLIAIYDKSLINEIENWMNADKKMSPQSFIENLNQQKINYINKEQIKKIGQPEKLFLNINSLSEYERAIQY